MENCIPQEIKNTKQAAKIEGDTAENIGETPCILEEIRIEELAIDGICGVY